MQSQDFAKCDFVKYYRSNDPRIPRHLISTEDDLRRKLAPDGRDHHLIQPGGAWHRHVQMNIAKRDGKNEELAGLTVIQDEAVGFSMSRLGVAVR